MKYKAIYNVLEESDSRIVYEDSGWRAVRSDILSSMRPSLFVVAEAPKCNLRLWITHESRDLAVTTARLDLNVDSREYHETQIRKHFRKQAEAASYLRDLLLPKEKESEKCA